tara:strand:+ start:1791 stop:3719 length:1929 start_codon:yes stop_codon:yes gene_type:complete
MSQTNQKFVELNLGLLNSAQDPTGIKEFEGADVSSLDIDQIALGTLRSADYFTIVKGVAGATSDQEANVNGAKFRISDGDLSSEGLVEYESVGGWRALYDVFGVDSPDFSSLGQSDNNLVSATVTDDMSSKIISVVIDPAGGYQALVPVDEFTVRVTAPSLVGDNYVQINFSTRTIPNTSYQIDKGLPVLLFVNGVSTGISIHVKSGEAYATGETGKASLLSDDLLDGDYGYRTSYRALQGSSIEATNGDRPTMAPSDSGKVTIKNFNDTGDRVTARAPEFGVSVLALFEPLVYRRDEEENDFFGVDLAKVAEISTGVYVDTLRIVEMDQLKTLEAQDENEIEYNSAINNPLALYDKLFSKDNRLFRIPRNRPDLIMYSRAGAWWGWQRESSFATDSPIVSIISVRDPSTLGGTLTTVIFTETGLYHLTGSGIEADPYVLTKQIDDISVDPKSIVNMNGIVMFTTKSDDGTYNKGAYGQKIYEYDLQKLVEVSARIQNNATLNSTAVVEFAEMLGGDKYFMKRVGIDECLVYHRDAKGWGTTTEAEENTSSWTWLSKDFTPTVMAQFKLGYARKFKLDFVGTITIKFNVWYEGRTELETFSLPLTNASRGEVTNFLPHIKGTIWNFELTGNTATLYNMYLVR